MSHGEYKVKRGMTGSLSHETEMSPNNNAQKCCTGNKNRIMRHKTHTLKQQITHRRYTHFAVKFGLKLPSTALTKSSYINMQQ